MSRPKPKPGGLGDQPMQELHENADKNDIFTSQKLRLLDNIKPDKVLLANINNHDILIKHLTIVVSSDAKKSAKKLIVDALKRPNYQSIALNFQWVTKQYHALDTKQVDYGTQLLEMVAAADVVESAISIHLRFCQLDKYGTDKITDALAKVSHLTSLILFDTTDSFALAATDKIADAKNDLKTFQIRKYSGNVFSLQAELSKAISKLISQKPSLEKLDLCGWGSNSYWTTVIDSIIISNIRHLDISKNDFHISAFLSLFARAKKLKVLNAEYCYAHSYDINDINKFLQELKDNKTLRSLNIAKTNEIELKLMPDVIRSNTTLQSLKFSLPGRGYYTEALYKDILKSLKDNTTLLRFVCDTPFISEGQDIAETSQTLHEFNGFKRENLKRNAKIYATNKMAIKAFVILFAKNRSTFMDWLPFELWLKIANYLNSPGLMDVEKRLLKAMKHYEQKNS